MKIVIYKADKEVPFGTIYNQLGSTDKIIFSNRSEKVSDFNKKGIDDLKYLVEPWLPKQSIIGSQEEDTIFYVPLEIKGKFMEILENLIDGFKKMMGKGKEDSVPTSEQLGLGKGSSLGSFYDDEMEIQEVIMTEAKQKLEMLFNSIADEENEIDAVLVCIFGNEQINILCSSQPKQNRVIEPLDHTTALLEVLVSCLSKTKQVNSQSGEFEHVVFQYSGRVIHITHLPKYGDYTFLVFVSATREGIEMFEFFREQHLEKIQELLDALFA